MNPFVLSLFLIIISLTTSILGAAERIVVPIVFDDRIPIQTSGGILFWGDVLFFDDWHIQENVVTKKYRLLDGNAIQHASGTRESCQDRLDEIQVAEGLLPMSGKTVIVLHGFGANAIMTRHLASWLRQEGGYDHVLNMTYPSMQQSILEHAKMLKQVVDAIPPTVHQIDFVGHSLGSIVIRRYLSGPLRENWMNMIQKETNTSQNEAYQNEAHQNEVKNAKQKPFLPDSRIGRFVMLGPPNNGAEIAEKFTRSSPLIRHLLGKSGDELGKSWGEAERSLGIPSIPFGIIAGGKSDGEGYSRLIEGDDDGIVSTAGTKLDGAAEWILLEVTHSELLNRKDVFVLIEQFLRTGTFTNYQ
ncbi:MAG: esterase/lipase family protein [Thermoguttaceae bacterium]